MSSWEGGHSKYLLSNPGAGSPLSFTYYKCSYEKNYYGNYDYLEIPKDMIPCPDFAPHAPPPNGLAPEIQQPNKDLHQLVAPVMIPTSLK